MIDGMSSSGVTPAPGPTHIAPGCCGLLQLCQPGFVAINTIHCQPQYVDRLPAAIRGPLPRPLRLARARH